MVPCKKTIRALLAVEQTARAMDRTPYLAILYFYYCTMSGKEVTAKSAKEATGLDQQNKNISWNIRILEQLKFISFKVGSKNRKIVKAHDVYKNPSMSRLSSLFLFSSPTHTSKKNRKESLDDTNAQVGDFSESDIRNDEDWKKAEPILLKYFKPHQIHPRHLIYKKRFEKLCDLLSDATFDFDAFCKWYRAEKYPLRKFNYGLFLYPDMIAEFRDVVDDEKDDIYLKTSSRLEDSESFKKGIAETDAFLEKITREGGKHNENETGS